MAKKSAGLLMYRRRHGALEIFLVHPGGPFWKKKDAGSWSIPKGEYTPAEYPFEVAKREFQEETSFKTTGEFIPLTPRKQPSAKIITAWALEGNYDTSAIESNTFRRQQRKQTSTCTTRRTRSTHQSWANYSVVESLGD